jgi:Type ISP C-terminal specificity domain
VQQNRKDYDPPIIGRRALCIHIIERSANLFSMLLVPPEATDGLFPDKLDKSRMIGDKLANISDAAIAYLGGLKGVADHPHLFHHAIAILHAPEYAAENSSALRQDWPRVPLPTSRDDLIRSADLGRKVAALLDPETNVDGVTAGKIRPELRLIGKPTKTDGSSFNESKGDCDVTARWGISGKGGICMPSNGHTESRAFEPAEAEAQRSDLLGPATRDIFLNDRAYWKNVPARVWEYTLGGYQVLKKWLSYREKALLGRGLSIDEVAYVQQVARRIAALLLLGPELDENYRRVKAATYPWPRQSGV